jgi:serine/threonine-protein kinase
MPANPTLLRSSVGEYQIVDFLGAGGMGEVYRGVHSKIGRMAAIKVLVPTALGDGGLTDRFFNEARIQASLQHPNIATLYDFLECRGQPCIIMEYIDGQTLAEYIQQPERLPQAETIRIFQAVVEAVSHIHSFGIVHRDIKSNNIKISTSGQVKLLDFGIAKSQVSPELTSTGVVVGTFGCLSPEQLKGKEADARSDIWALGVLLYELTTGTRPFVAAMMFELCNKIIKDGHLPPEKLNAALLPDLSRIVARCLKKKPEDRYQSAQEILHDLIGVTTKADTIRDKNLLRPVAKPPLASPVSPIGPKLRKHWLLLSAISTMVLAVSIFVGIYWMNHDSNASELPSETAQTRSITIKTFEGGAQLYDQNNRLLGITPYEYPAQMNRPVKLILKLEGYEDTPVNFTPTWQSNRLMIINMKRK